MGVFDRVKRMFSRHYNEETSPTHQQGREVDTLLKGVWADIRRREISLIRLEDKYNVAVRKAPGLGTATTTIVREARLEGNG